MLQPRIPSPLTPSPTITALAAALTSLTFTTSCTSQTYLPKHNLHPHTSHIQIRTAYHAAQGRANGPKSGPGKRLGLKTSATQYVVPGTIIFRQRGTKWHPGENVGMGRDHTIFAKVHGYVRYYRDPGDTGRRKGRGYIGVSLEREGAEARLPTPGNRAAGRRVGMVGVPIKSESVAVVTEGVSSGEEEASRFLESHLSEGSKSGRDLGREKIMRAGEYRISNTELAREAVAEQVYVRPYVKKDRWTAWKMREKKAKVRKAKMVGGKGKKMQKKRK